MRKKIFAGLAVGVMMFGAVGVASATPVQWSSSTGGNDHWYDVVNYQGTWDAANSDAQSKSYNGANGHLATLTSAEENSFVWSNLPYFGYWLGGFQYDKNAEPAGHWAWVTGEEWNFTNWNPWEPNESAGNEDYLQFDWYYGEGNWNDFFNDQPSHPLYVFTNPPGGTGGYIVEYENAPVPEPATMLLMGTGLAGLIGARRKKKK